MSLVAVCAKCGRWVTILPSGKLRHHYGPSRGRLFCEEINGRGLRENRMPKEGTAQEIDHEETRRRNEAFLKKTRSPDFLR